MTSAARTAGKYGRLAAQFPAAVRDLTCYSAGPLPQAPASVAVPAVTGWGMLSNDTLGDCGVAGLEHGFMASAATIGVTEGQATDAEAASYYLAYTGGQDSGVVLSQYLAHVKASGYYGHKVAAYAPVSVQDVNTLHFAVNAYDFAYTGITVYEGMEQAFSAGAPWDLESVSGAVAGGHCVPVVAYDSQYLYAVTWGKVQPIAYPAWARVAEEAWAVITGEVTTAGTGGHGINLAALQADISRLAA